MMQKDTYIPFVPAVAHGLCGMHYARVCTGGIRRTERAFRHGKPFSSITSASSTGAHRAKISVPALILCRTVDTGAAVLRAGDTY